MRYPDITVNTHDKVTVHIVTYRLTTSTSTPQLEQPKAQDLRAPASFLALGIPGAKREVKLPDWGWLG